MNEMTRLMRAEWIKLRSLRSTKWTLAVMVIATVGLGAIFNAEAAAHWSSFSPHDRATWDPTNASLTGTIFGQLAIAVFGVLAITSEYSSGTIRSSVAAAPRRTRLLAAKAAVYGGLALVVGELISFTTYLVGQALFAGKVPVSHLSDPSVVRAVIMTGGYLAVVCLIAIGVGLALRHTAGAITTMVALLLVLPGILAALPSSLQDSIGRFMPEQIAGSSTGAVLPEAHYFGPWVGMALLVIYAAGALGVGGWTFARRDIS